MANTETLSSVSQLDAQDQLVDLSVEESVTDDALIDSSKNLEHALIEAHNGVHRSKDEIRTALLANGEFGKDLQAYIVERLAELNADGDAERDLGQVIKEVCARVENIHAAVLSGKVETSELHNIVDRLRISRVGRMTGRLAIAASGFGIAWAATKSFQVSVGQFSIFAGVGAMVSEVARSGMRYASTKLSGRAQESVFDDDGKRRLEFIQKHESELASDMTPEQKQAMMIWLESVEETDMLREDTTAYVGRQFTEQSDWSVEANRQEIAVELTYLVLGHISEVYDINKPRIRKQLWPNDQPPSQN